MTNEELVKKFCSASADEDFRELYLYLGSLVSKNVCSNTQLMLYRYIEYAKVKKKKNFTEKIFLDALGRPLAQGDFVSSIVLNERNRSELGFGIIRNFSEKSVLLTLGVGYTKNNLVIKQKANQILKLSSDFVCEVAKADFRLVKE